MPKSQFDDVPEWPEAKTDANPRVVKGGNNPPLEDQVTMDFEDQLREAGVITRIDELIASAQRVPDSIDDVKIAGKVGDLIKLARPVREKVEGFREVQNRPLLTAQRTLKARADSLLVPLEEAMRVITVRLHKYAADQAEEARKRQREADEQARAAQAAADEVHRKQEEARIAALPAGADPETAPAPAPAPRLYETVQVEKPVARGDYGARVGTTQSWEFEIENMRKVPDRFLKHPKVKEALESVIRTAIRTEKVRELAGVRIWSVDKASVR